MKPDTSEDIAHSIAMETSLGVSETLALQAAIEKALDNESGKWELVKTENARLRSELALAGRLPNKRTPANEESGDPATLLRNAQTTTRATTIEDCAMKVWTELSGNYTITRQGAVDLIRSVGKDPLVQVPPSSSPENSHMRQSAIAFAKALAHEHHNDCGWDCRLATTLLSVLDELAIAYRNCELNSAKIEEMNGKLTEARNQNEIFRTLNQDLQQDKSSLAIDYRHLQLVKEEYFKTIQALKLQVEQMKK
jgi:hypothetical protein